MSDPSTSDLAAFLRSHREEILARWHASVVDRPQSQGLSYDALLDHLPDLLDAIADTGEERISDASARLGTETAERHALERLGEGMDLSHVVVELAVLRDAILHVWDAERAPGSSRPEVRFLNRSVDRAIAASVDRYVHARDRTLVALDRISTASLESRRVDDLLRRLLSVMLETTGAVDTGVILLREGDHLVVRAAVGVEEELHLGFRLKIGEGFAGRVAAERRACTLTAEQMGEVKSPFLRAKKLRALYGIPLLDAGEVVGVAHIGSLSAPDISDQDKRLFEVLGSRASSAIVQHVLHQDVERRASQLKAVLDSIPDAVFMGSRDGMKETNPPALELLGFSSINELNRAFGSLHTRFRIRRADTGEPMPPNQWPFAKALSGASSTSDVLIESGATGKDVVLRCSAAPVRSPEGRIEEAVCICIDVTEERQREQEHQVAVEEAQQAVADRQHVLGVVSHDLRNPLSTVMLAAEALRHVTAPGNDAMVRRAIESIVRAGKRMDRLIGDLLDLTSVQAGRLSVTLGPMSAVAAVEEALASVRADAELKELEVRLEQPPAESPLLVRGDRDRVVQALTNLLSNAVKVTARGFVAASARPEGNEVVFTVRDTGPGIAPELVDKMFEPYWRAPAAAYRGTGLGLSIVRGIVEAHGGRIWIESEEGRGTAVSFTLPAA